MCVCVCIHNRVNLTPFLVQELGRALRLSLGGASDGEGGRETRICVCVYVCV